MATATLILKNFNLLKVPTPYYGYGNINFENFNLFQWSLTPLNGKGDTNFENFNLQCSLPPFMVTATLIFKI